MWFHRSKLPFLEAELLWGYLLNLPREKLYLFDQFIPNYSQQKAFERLEKRRLKGEPIAYLIGKKSFWEDDFVTTNDVLIPRPETELLVELTLKEKANYFSILELGTGSGAIAISIAKARSNWKITALDISYAALQIAITNGTRLEIKNIQWLQSNWFQNLSEQQFDLIISNPPYLEQQDPHLKEEIRFEPQTALVSLSSGLADIEIISQQAPKYLKKHGKIYIEHGFNQSQKAQKILFQNGFRKIDTILDLSGHPRITTAIWET